MEDDFIQMLMVTPAIKAVVAGRIWPNRRPQGVRTSGLVIRKISGGREYADDGDIGIATARVQIDCDAPDYSAAKALARLVIERLSFFVGAYGKTDFRLVMLDDERDGDAAGVDAPEYVQRVSLDFIVTHSTC